MNGEPTNGAERLANNAVLQVMGRLAMLAAAPILAYVGLLVIEMKADLRIVQSQMSLQLAERYSSNDAGRDHKLYQMQVDELKRRIEIIERRDIKDTR